MKNKYAGMNDTQESEQIEDIDYTKNIQYVNDIDDIIAIYEKLYYDNINRKHKALKKIDDRIYKFYRHDYNNKKLFKKLQSYDTKYPMLIVSIFSDYLDNKCHINMLDKIKYT